MIETPSYLTYTELETLTGSTYGQTILEAIIDEAERQIDGKLAGYDISGSGDIIKSATVKLSMAQLIERMRFDGSKTSSITLGDLSQSDTLDAQKAALIKEAWELVDEFIKQNASTDQSATLVYKVNA